MNYYYIKNLSLFFMQVIQFLNFVIFNVDLIILILYNVVTYIFVIHKIKIIINKRYLFF